MAVMALPPAALALWRFGAVSGASAVLLGAFGAHGLAKHFEANPRHAATWATAAQYHLVSSAVTLVAASQRKVPAAALLAAGTVVFSGSLYALVLTNVKALGAVTPVGGLLMVGGWLALLV